MDLDLINFWISDLKMSINENTLYLHLKSYKHDPIYSYIIPLCSDKKNILSFLGFDASLEYDKMTIKNQFEYLCTSSKLNPKYISYLHFKGPGPKNMSHSKFNAHLLEKYKYIRPPQHDYDAIKQEAIKWKSEALSYFNKDKEYKTYQYQYDIFERLEEARMKVHKSNKEGYTYKDFERFMFLHGLTNIIKWDDEILLDRWVRFKNSNWSPLARYI